jgi:hypothetical protein
MLALFDFFASSVSSMSGLSMLAHLQLVSIPDCKILATDLLVSHDGLKPATDILSNYSAISSFIK